MTAVVNHYPAYVPTERQGVLLTTEKVKHLRVVYQRVMAMYIKQGAKNEQGLELTEQLIALCDLAEKQLAKEGR